LYSTIDAYTSDAQKGQHIRPGKCVEYNKAGYTKGYAEALEKEAKEEKRSK
jgi:hypothetical protein